MENKIGLIVLTALLAGCASTPDHYYHPSREEQAQSAVRQLYADSRMIRVTNGIVENAFVSDSNIVASCETLLLHYSRSDEESVRLAAASGLSHFGTMQALERSLEIAKREPSAKSRAELWRDIIQLLHGPQTSYDPVTRIFADGTVSTNRMYRLSVPDITILVHSYCGCHNMHYILPPELDLGWLQGQVLEQFEKDDGAWTVRYCDRVPFVPFLVNRGVVTQTVREAIAESFMDYGHDTTSLRQALQKYAASTNPAIREPAQDVIDYFTKYRTNDVIQAMP
jgi:hypothetical protein